MMVMDEDGLMDLTWLTPAEAAAKVRVSVETVYAWARSGKILVQRGEGVSRNRPRMLVEKMSLLDCELAMRKSKMGRPRVGTKRGRST